MSWKRIGKTKWKNNNHILYVEKDPVTGHMIKYHGKGTQMYNVVAQVEGYPSSILPLGDMGDDATFVSKKEAVKYAKIYMKENPKGFD